MLPSVGYFKCILCPYFANGNCTRPHCQFRHEQLPVKQPKPTPSTLKVQDSGPSNEESCQVKSKAIEMMVSEAVKQVLKENSHLLENFDASKIMELVGKQNLVEKVVQGFAPEPTKCDTANQKNKSNKSYTIPVGTPAYTPTPLAVLKSSKPSSSKDESYTPTDGSAKTSHATYNPSKSTPKQDVYTPSGPKLPLDVNYTPSKRASDNITDDRYTPPSNLECDYADYQPTSKEFNIMEPSYSPSCTAPGVGVNYQPSSITSLVREPTYSPAQSTNQTSVEYTPSSINSFTMSPEKYLEDLFETPGEESEKNVRADNSSRKRSKEDEEKKRKEKERLRQKEKKREREKSDKSSSSKKSSSSSSKNESKSSHKQDKVKSKTTKADMELDSDVDEECYRIFQEYQQSPSSDRGNDNSKRKSDEVISSPTDSPVIPVKKQRVAHASTESAPARPLTSAPPKPPPRLSPGMMMIERFKKLQEAKAASSKSTTSQPIPSSSSSSPFPKPSTSGPEKNKRIAHTPNVSSLLNSKPKNIPITSATPTELPASTSQASRSLITKQNVMKKVVPKLPRPVIAVEFGCRVPANVRQKYLNVLVDETLKIYDNEEDAYQRAVEEEKTAYAKCSSKVVYVNVITNLVQRIRREVESNSTNQNSNHGERKTTVSHSAMLAGKGGATVSWSIEKPRNGKVDANLLKGAAFYKLLERYILTMEQQDFNGYPRPDPFEKGKAVVNSANKFKAKSSAGSLNLGPNQRLCDRCGTEYKVNSKGLAIKEDDTCMFHWGKPFKRRGETRYSCCQGEPNSEGCSVSKWHVSDTISTENLKKGFVRTMAKSSPPDGDFGVYALDCEMCYTTEGPELTRVTVVSSECQVIYETLVKPDNPILDYNTRFSGINEQDLVNVRTTIRDVQAVFLNKFSEKTILIGHSFDSDLRALKIIHDSVIDTSIVFPHSRGPPYKKALRTLCADILQKIIQNDVGGHDSAEDARACMDLMLWKVKQDLKALK